MKNDLENWPNHKISQTQVIRTRLAFRSQISIFTIFPFADQLGHGSHGTVYAPAAGLKQHMVMSPNMVEVSITL